MKKTTQAPTTGGDSQTGAIRMLAIAPSAYGKTYQICHWILSQMKLKRWKATRIILFSPTAPTDSSMQPLIKECLKNDPLWLENNYRDHVDEDLLEQLYGIQKSIKERTPKKLKHWLVIMDDAVGEQAMTSKRGILLKIATSGRHFNISSIISMQAYRSTMNPIVRQQTSCLMIGRLNSLREWEDIAESYSQGLADTSKEAKKKMMVLIADAVQSHDNHGFIVVWPYRQYGTGRLQQNLDGPYYDK